MKVIELLNKIANNEKLPKKIVIDDIVFHLNGFRYKTNNGYTLGEKYKLDEVLNKKVYILDDNKVKIIEDKPIIDNISIQTNRKITGMKDRFVERMLNHFYDMDLEVREKMNEIIKVVNYLLEKSDE